MKATSGNQDYLKRLAKETDAVEERRLATSAANCFSKRVSVNDCKDLSSIYLMIISDNHNNITALRRQLEQAKMIPNCYVLFLGDQANVALKNTKASVFKSNTPKQEMDAIVSTLWESGFDLNRVFYIDGNHEKHVEDDTSLLMGQQIMAQLGVADNYAIHAMDLFFELNHPTKNRPVIADVSISHGQGRGGGPGAEADKSLRSNASLVIAGDTHKVVYGMQNKQYYVQDKKGPRTKTSAFVNVGTDLSEEYYLQEKGFPPRAVRDGEIIRLGVSSEASKTSTKIDIDFLNIRQILSEESMATIKDVSQRLVDIENSDFASRSDIEAAYKNLALSIKKPTGGALIKGKKYPNVLRLIPLSGAQMGDSDGVGEDKLREIVEKIKGLDDTAKVILNGDMIRYKPANLLHRINYPEETLEYLIELAKILEPIKDKIAAYNSGNLESKIMCQTGNLSEHAKKLAELSMERLQLEEALAYEPMSQSDLRVEATKQQTAHVVEYNKTQLEKAYRKTMFDEDLQAEIIRYNNAIRDGVPYVEGFSPEVTEEELQALRLSSKEDFKIAMVPKLTHDEILLSNSRLGKEKIDRMFPLEFKSFRVPNHNLIQNILCKLLEIDPKTISINSNLNEACECHFDITNSSGAKQGINVLVSYKPISKNGVTRKAIESHLNKMDKGADVYICNGQDYLTIGRELVYHKGMPIMKDYLHISGGRLDRTETCCDRVFEVRAEQGASKVIQTGIFEDTSKTRLTCANTSIESTLQETFYSDKALETAVSQLICQSMDRTFERHERMLAMQRNQKSAENVLKRLRLKEGK